VRGKHTHTHTIVITLPRGVTNRVCLIIRSQLIGKRGLWGREVEERGMVCSSPLAKHPAMNLSQLVPISTVAKPSS
jgi:hypothetical protein